MLIPLLLVLSAAPARPDATPSLEVTGVPHARAVDREELLELAGPPMKLTIDGSEHTARAVRLDAILEKLGFTPGPMAHDTPVREKRAGWKMAVMATAADGFQALFSCAEISQKMGATQALIVVEMDGKPVPGEKGPFRLVVPTDKEPSRSIWAVKRLDVLDLRAK